MKKKFYEWVANMENLKDLVNVDEDEDDDDEEVREIRRGMRASHESYQQEQFRQDEFWGGAGSSSAGCTSGAKGGSCPEATHERTT